MEDTKIYLITCVVDVEGRFGYPIGKREVLVSHGVGNNTLNNYCLPCDPPRAFNPEYDEQGVYIEA